jgi:hypothetical protein
LTQCRERPEAYGEPSRLLTIPSNPSLQHIPTATSTTKVGVTANADFTLQKVTVDDGTGPKDVTSQIGYKSSDTYEGDLQLAPGKTYTVVATAEIYCWYCTGQKWQSSAKKTFFVCSAPPPGTMTSSTFEQGGSMLSWANPSGATISLASDTGTSATRWKLRALIQSTTSDQGTIESVQSPCMCLRSSDDQPNTAPTLALCDQTDPRQQWFSGLRQTGAGNKGFYDFNNVKTQHCLTEGGGGQITQKDCNQTPDQLWAVRDNVANTFKSSSYPWDPPGP